MILTNYLCKYVHAIYRSTSRASVCNQEQGGKRIRAQTGKAGRATGARGLPRVLLDHPGLNLALALVDARFYIFRS